jgi:outer membrane protein
MGGTKAGVYGTAMIASLAIELIGAGGVRADTLAAALAKAHLNNPQLNTQRAFVRQTEEQVSIAVAGFLPNVSANASVGPQFSDNKLRVNDTHRQERLKGASVGVSASQTLLDGMRTPNRVEAANGSVLGAREVLRMMTQQVLLDATTAYMTVLRDAAIAQLQRHNVEMLQEQLDQVRRRFSTREVTATDVAQTQSRLAAARWARLAAESALNSSRAAYRRVIGEEQRERVEPAAPVDRLSPTVLDEAIAVAQKANPSITAAVAGIDVAAVQVKIAQGALYPTVKLDVAAQQSWGTSSAYERQFAAGAFVSLSVPIFQGGAEYATIRESKEILEQKKFDLDRVRDLVRFSVVESWGQLGAAKGQIEAAQAQVKAAEEALNGVSQEARAGQRTTLDVLNAQQELISARVTLVTTQRDRVLASFSLLAAIGRLAPESLQLPSQPTVQAAARK